MSQVEEKDPEDSTLEDIRLLTQMYPGNDSKVFTLLGIIHIARKRLKGVNEGVSEIFP